MTVYWLKSIIAVVFIVLAISAAFSMLTLMGRTEKKSSPERLRRLHRVAGYLFALLLLGLSALGIGIFVRDGDSLSLRAVNHGFIGLFLLALFFLKLLIARFYRQFLRMMPALGMAVFSLSLVMFWMAGYFFLRAAVSRPLPGGSGAPASVSSLRNTSLSLVGDAERGAVLFEGQCASCHYPDRTETKSGPGLAGLFEMSSLPHSGKPVTEANVREQLVRPALRMPSFAGLSDQELTDLLAYLRML